FICFLALSVAFLPSFNGQAQSIITDSLKEIIEKPGNENGKRIEAMGRLSKIMAVQNKLPEALKMAKKAQELSHGEEDGRYGALVQSTLSYLYVQQDSLKLAFQAIDSAEWY